MIWTTRQRKTEAAPNAPVDLEPAKLCGHFYQKNTVVVQWWPAISMNPKEQADNDLTQMEIFPFPR